MSVPRPRNRRGFEDEHGRGGRRPNDTGIREQILDLKQRIVAAVIGQEAVVEQLLIALLDKTWDEATSKGWTVVSMKDDWAAIFPPK